METNNEHVAELVRLNNSIGHPELSAAVESIVKSKDDRVYLAFLGQFKSGKSSLINSLIGENILPVGVVPVTAIVTQLRYGPKPELKIRFVAGHEMISPLEDLDLYVTEKKNPENFRKVAFAVIEHPALEKIPNLYLVDTPGLNSFYKHNSEVTLQWLPFTGVAIIAVSAERPLSEEDIHLIKGTAMHCPEIVVALTKTDFFKAEELAEIREYIVASLYKALNRKIPVFEYSVFSEEQFFRDRIKEKLLIPYNQNHLQKRQEIIRYKIKSAIQTSITYAEITYQTALKREKEKDAVVGFINEMKSNRHHKEKEMLLSGTFFKGEIRQKIEKIVLPHRKSIIQNLTSSFKEDYFTWKGSLFNVTRKYEQWLNKRLGSEISVIDDDCYNQINQILKEPLGYYEYSALKFRQRLTDELNTLFGVTLPEVSWQISFRGIDKPDISVYRAFDSHLDLLLFFLPMGWFRGIFYRHFLNQIPLETEKNMYRYVSDLSEKIIKSINDIHRQALLFINNEYQELEQILISNKSDIHELKATLAALKKLSQRYLVETNI